MAKWVRKEQIFEVQGDRTHTHIEQDYYVTLPEWLDSLGTSVVSREILPLSDGRIYVMLQIWEDDES